MWFDWAADKRDESAGGTEQTHLSFLLVFSPALTPLLLRCSLMLPLFFLPRAPHLSGDGWVQLGAETLMREREAVIFVVKGEREREEEAERMGFRCSLGVEMRG